MRLINKNKSFSLATLAYRACFWVSLLVVTACGGGGGGDSGPQGPAIPQVTLQGVVHKGPVNGAVVSLYEINEIGERIYIADAQTDSTGAYSFNVNFTVAKNYVLVAKGGTYIDAATGLSVQMEGEEQLVAYISLPNSNSSNRIINLTPITTLASAYTDYLVSSQGMELSAAIEDGFEVFNGLFNLQDASQSLAIPPITELSKLNDQEQGEQKKNLVGLIAGFDQWAVDDADLESAMSIVDLLVQDIREDGVIGNSGDAVSTLGLVEAAERIVARITSNQITELFVAADARSVEANLGDVSFNVRPVAANDTVATIKNESLIIDTETLVSNDSDDNISLLVVAKVGQPSVVGAQVVFADNAITYVPASGYLGSDSFSYEIRDEHGLTDEAIVNVRVRESSDQPLALDDEYQIDEDSSLTFPVAELLENDLEPVGGDIHFLRLVPLDATVGQVSLNGEQISYVPQADYFGVDTFNYEIEDEEGNRSQAIVNINVAAVNDMPVAVDDHFTIDEDTELNTTLAYLIDNDSDVEEGMAIVEVSSTPLTKGSLTLNNGQVKFIPEEHFNGVASFQYVLQDSGNQRVTANVTIDVRSVNDLPDVSDNNYTTPEDTSINIPYLSLLSNDVDHDGDVLTVVGIENVQNGTVEVINGASVAFLPAENYAGIATFDYVVSDGSEQVSGNVQITVTPVNDLPKVVGESYNINEDTALNINTAELLRNDSDVEDGELTIVEVVNHNTTRGTASLASGVIAFAPELDYMGETSFGYFVEDSDGGRSLGTVDVVVASVNDDPVLGTDSYDTQEDFPIEISFTSLLSNDSDVDSDLSVEMVANAVHGDTEILNGGKVRFSPDENFFGLASFEYIVSDGEGGSFIGQVEITVDAVNDPPEAVADHGSMEVYTSLNINAFANDYDIDGDFSIDSVDGVSANGGSIVMSSPGVFTYNAPAGFIGTDSFSYTIIDDQNETDSAQVTVDVYSEVGNVSAYAHSTCSSEAPNSISYCLAAIDGVLEGYTDGDDAREWASNGETVGAYIQLDWMQQVTIDSITLHDRPNSNDQVRGGLLHFSDGSTISVGVLANNGNGVEIDFDPKHISWVRFEVTETSGSTLNAGLMEIVVSGEISPLRKTLNRALYSDVSTSHNNSSLSQISDGVLRDSSNGWLSSGIGDYVRIAFDQPQSISKVSLRGLLRGNSQINAAQISFSDGSSFATGAISKTGDLHEFEFPVKNISWLQFTINSGVGAEIGLAELAVFSSLAEQNILFTEQFRYAGELRQWTITDEGPHHAPSTWHVEDGAAMDTSYILGFTTEGYEIGSYVLSDVINVDEFDVLVNLLSDRDELAARDGGPGYIGVMFGYQDADNFYRLSISGRKGYRKLEKKVNGVFSELASSTQSYSVGEWSNVRIVKRNGIIVVYVNGQQALAAQDSTFGAGKLGVWGSRGELNMFDNLTLLTPPDHPLLAMVKPYEAGVTRSSELNLEFLSMFSAGGVEFVINEGEAGEYRETIQSEPYTSTVSFISPQILSVSAYLLNEEGGRIDHPDAKVVRSNLGVNGIHLVTFGDSITEGFLDNVIDDDVSLDGRNSGGGYQPVLNNHLTAHFGVPVSVENEGNPGDVSSQAIYKIQSILARGNGAEGYLVMLGTNDSGKSVSSSAYKQNLHDIISAIVETGAKVWLPQLPPVLQHETLSAIIRGYNLRIDELVSEFAVSNPGMVAHGPDFYQHFTDNPDGMDSDNLHPNGLGYSRMGQLWSDVLINSL